MFWRIVCLFFILFLMMTEELTLIEASVKLDSLNSLSFKGGIDAWQNQCFRKKDNIIRDTNRVKAHCNNMFKKLKPSVVEGREKNACAQLCGIDPV